MKETFYNPPHNTNNIFVQSKKKVKYGDKSLRALGQHLWNSPSEKIESTTSKILMNLRFHETWL